MYRIFHVLFLLLGSLCLFIADTLAQQSGTIKVLSYNVHHCNPPAHPGHIDVEAIAGVIRKSGADLVGLQEIDVHTDRSGKALNQAEELGRLTGMYHYFAKAIDYQGGEYGVALLSKFPIIDSFRFSLPMDERLNGEARVIGAIRIHVPGFGDLLFGNTHLDLAEAHQLLQVDYIIDKSREVSIPLVLTGDFNAEPGSTVMERLDRYFIRAGKAGAASFTYPATEPDRAIDFIFHGKNDPFEVLTYDVIDDRYASDHRPVFAELRF